MLDGGRILVPPEKEDLFLREYAKAIFMGERLYVVEKKTSPFFPLLLEMDFKMNRQLEEKEIIIMMKELSDSIADLCPKDSDKSFIVSIAPPDKEGDLVKSGIHVVWKNLILDQKNAALFRTAMRMNMIMRTESGTIPKPSESWSVVLDPAIFRENGLRMLWSRKAKICPQCHSKKSPTPPPCDKCGGNGKIDAGRPYDILYAFNGDGTIDEVRTKVLKEDQVALIKACSIRVSPDIKIGIEVMSTYPDAYHFLKEEDEKEKKEMAATAFATKNKLTNGTSVRVIRRSSNKNLRCIPSDDPKFKIIADLISKEVGNPVLMSLKQSVIGDIYFASTSCKYCLNKGSEHNSSTNFFVLRPSGIERRCYCKKVDLSDSTKIPCSKWVSDTKIIPADISGELFDKSAIEKRRCVGHLTKMQDDILSSKKVKDMDDYRIMDETTRSGYQEEIDPITLVRRLSEQGSFHLDLSSTNSRGPRQSNAGESSYMCSDKSSTPKKDSDEGDAEPPKKQRKLRKRCSMVISDDDK